MGGGEGEDLKRPLQLAFETREGTGGGEVGEGLKCPLRLVFEAREGVGVVQDHNLIKVVNIIF
jgi:hypothetical protein